MHLLKNTELVTLMGPSTSSTADSTSAVVDLSNCAGAFIVAGVGDAAAACAVNLVTGSTSDASGSTAATFSISTADHCAVFDLYKPNVRYAKVVFAPGAGAVDGRHVHAIKYGVRKSPVTNSSTSVAGSTLLVGSS